MKKYTKEDAKNSTSSGIEEVVDEWTQLCSELVPSYNAAERVRDAVKVTNEAMKRDDDIEKQHQQNLKSLTMERMKNRATSSPASPLSCDSSSSPSPSPSTPPSKQSFQQKMISLQQQQIQLTQQVLQSNEVFQTTVANEMKENNNTMRQMMMLLQQQGSK